MSDYTTGKFTQHCASVEIINWSGVSGINHSM